VPDPEDPIKGLVGLRRGGFNAGMADGSVHFISERVDREMLQRLFSRDDGEPVTGGPY
jgi:prepilin-type processing-associated H-X9-DG protein